MLHKLAYIIGLYSWILQCIFPKNRDILSIIPFSSLHLLCGYNPYLKQVAASFASVSLPSLFSASPYLFNLLLVFIDYWLFYKSQNYFKKISLRKVPLLTYPFHPILPVFLRLLSWNCTDWGLINNKIYFSQFWSPEVQDQGPGRSSVWWGPPSWFIDSLTLAVTFHRRRENELVGLGYMGSNSIHENSTSWPLP